MHFVVWATDRPGALAERQRVREAHRARLRDPGAHAVKVLLGGPTLGDPGGAMNGTLLVIEAVHIDAVRRFIEDDPYMRAGVYATVEIRPWQWGLGRPAAAP